MYLPDLGGLETFTSRLAHELCTRGHEVMVATTWNDPSLPQRQIVDGIRVARLPFHKAMRGDDPLTTMRTLKAAAALKAEFRPDVIHVHFADPNVFFHLRTRAAYDAPMVVTFHIPFSDGRTARGGVVDEMVGAARALIAVSTANARAVAIGVGVPVNAIEVLCPGVPDVEWVPPAQPRPCSGPFVFVGRLVRDKGCDIAVEALAGVRAAGWPASLRIVGAGPETPHLQALIEARGLRPSVELAGGVEPRAVPGLMAEACAVLIPSRYAEPFGMVAVEAALMCRPVIAAATGGLQEIVVHERTGYLVPVDDPAALSAHMIRMLADPAAAAAMGNAGRARALSRYSLHAVADRYLGIYSAATQRELDG